MGRWFCDCKPPLEVAIRTSKTMKNPGRRFKCCPIHKRNGGCDFFEWVDREMFRNCGGGCCIHGDWSGHEVSMGYCSVHQQRTAPCSHGVCTNGDVPTHCSSHHSHAPLEDYNESTSAFERGKYNYWIWFLGCVAIVVLYRALQHYPFAFASSTFPFFSWLHQLDWQMVVSPFSLAEQTLAEVVLCQMVGPDVVLGQMQWESLPPHQHLVAIPQSHNVEAWLVALEHEAQQLGHFSIPIPVSSQA
ncbi:hypothetical protein G4B88_005048 [Cannabis sativa]|uniref:GRF-type domain-containing protein n=1 Tax=Cannabis sativa TaxID=3483 RepID=A0A7J6H6E2_CANSA|nr:hypothetical protein G4B88_005048 [Cannabis sativa]